MATNENQDEDLEALSNIGVWGQRDQGILVDNTKREITSSDIEYLQLQFPYLQILNIDATFENYNSVQFIRAKSGWTIQDLDDGLCTSAGSFLFGGSDSPSLENTEKKDPDLIQEYINERKGTIIKQTFDTAQEMVDLVKTRWKGGIEIISGTTLMKWALWVAAENIKLKVIGFEPTEKDNAKRNRLTRLEAERALIPKSQRQR
jgi:hypothetical protein